MSPPVALGILWPDGMQDTVVVSSDADTQQASSSLPRWVECEDPSVQEQIAQAFGVPEGKPDGWGQFVPRALPEGLGENRSVTGANRASRRREARGKKHKCRFVPLNEFQLRKFFGGINIKTEGVVVGCRACGSVKTRNRGADQTLSRRLS